MNNRERDRLLASLTDDELSALRARAGDAAPPDDDEDAEGDDDEERQFVRRLLAKPNDWLAETLDRLSSAGAAPPDAGDDNREFLHRLLSSTRGGPPETKPTT